MTVHLGIEALSALVDGEATPEEEAHVAGCASCQESAGRLRMAAAAAAESPSPRPADDVDGSIRGALAAWDDQPPRPARRPALWLLPVLAVAAAAFVVLAAIALLGHSQASKSASTSATTGVSSGPSAGAESSATTSGAARGQVRLPADLGAFSDPAQLTAAIRSRLPASTAPGSVPETPPVAACAEPAAAAGAGASARGQPQLVGTLRWRGTASAAYVVPLTGATPGPGAVVVVVSDSSCAVLVTTRI